MTKGSFRPSHFPALSECVHHESVEGDSEAAQRGTGIHADIARVLKAEDSIKYESEAPPVQFSAAWTIARIMEGWRVVAVELPVELIDADGEFMTEGTVDLLLERRQEYQVVDWKTGDKNGYHSQLAGYISAVSDLYPCKKISGTIVYLDLREEESVNLNVSQSFGLVEDLWIKWKNKENEPHTINPYCSYCGLRGECPAWRAEGAYALDTVKELGVPTGSALVTAKVDALKNNPSKLEEFLLAWKRAETLVGEWKLKDALKTHMENGFKAEHHILVHASSSSSTVRSIDPEQYLEKVASQIGFMNAAPAIRVDPDKAIESWKKYYGYGDDAKFPVEIKEAEVEKYRSSYVREKGKSGAGDARKKRKELE